MIRLGHIDYSNCVPVHALLLECGAPDVAIVRDIPSRLNAALAAGEIDVAPCSSIEYARHPDEYSILSRHAIGSAGPVQSILLESTVPLHELHGRTVAVPTASATSTVLLRILLELRTGIHAQYEDYAQGDDVDPIASGAGAALRIGDVALRRTAPADRHVYDLGAEWWSWTGLPFAFAVWQVRRDTPRAEVRRLADRLIESRAWFDDHADELAARYSPSFGIAPDRLLAYWRSLRFDLDDAMQQGLLRFYRHAAELGEAPAAERLSILEP